MGNGGWLPALLSTLVSLTLQQLACAGVGGIAAWVLLRRGRGRRGGFTLLLADRVLRRFAPWSALVAGGAWAAAGVVFPQAELALEPFRLAPPGIWFALCAAATGGSCLLLAAGHYESRGRIDRARRLVRRSGLACAAVLVVLVGLMMPRLLAAPTPMLLTASVLTALAAGCALLAALSRKPRPTGSFSVGLHALGTLSFFLASTVAGN